MEITRLSTKGQIIIPKSIRAHFSLETGQELLVLETEDGILLKPKKPFADTLLEDIAGCLKYDGEPKTIEEMDEGIRKGIESKHDCR
ncbi:MAG: AbrB/MazE/SpoVT family DNA-binding domain-containing protein [Pseudomonadales bacterium]